jgi:uncharacterized membrane protein (TIGR02234 family)
MSSGTGSAPGPASRRRSSFGPTVLAGLAAAAVATVGSGRPWAQARTTAQGERTVAAAGTDVAAAALPLALVALACWGAFLVLRTRGRRVVALLGVLAAAGSAVAGGTSAGKAEEVAAQMLGGASDVSTSTTGWPVVTLVACVVAVATFAVALVRAPHWPQMSARYDSPAERASDDRAMSDADVWRALDEGRDPTA